MLRGWRSAMETLDLGPWRLGLDDGKMLRISVEIFWEKLGGVTIEMEKSSPFNGLDFQVSEVLSWFVNGHFGIRRYVSTICLVIFCVDVP